MSDANKGKNHRNYGKKFSAETKQKMSDAHKGKKHSAETRKKMSQSLMGRKTSDETKKKQSEFMKGNTRQARKVINTITNETYDSAKEAAYCFGIKYNKLIRMLNGKTTNKSTLQYL